MFKKGLLVVTTGRESIKLGPPLIISKKQLSTGVKIIKGCMEIVDKKIYSNERLHRYSLSKNRE